MERVAQGPARAQDPASGRAERCCPHRLASLPAAMEQLVRGWAFEVGLAAPRPSSSLLAALSLGGRQRADVPSSSCSDPRMLLWWETSECPAPGSTGRASLGAVLQGDTAFHFHRCPGDLPFQQHLARGSVCNAGGPGSLSAASTWAMSLAVLADQP